MSATDTRRLLTVTEAAKRLRCSELTLRRKIAAGSIAAYRVASDHGPLRIYEDALEGALRPVQPKDFEHASSDGSLRRQGQLRPDADPAERVPIPPGTPPPPRPIKKVPGADEPKVVPHRSRSHAVPRGRGCRCRSCTAAPAAPLSTTARGCARPVAVSGSEHEERQRSVDTTQHGAGSRSWPALGFTTKEIGASLEESGAWVASQLTELRDELQRTAH